MDGSTLHSFHKTGHVVDLLGKGKHKKHLFHALYSWTILFTGPQEVHEEWKTRLSDQEVAWSTGQSPALLHDARCLPPRLPAPVPDILGNDNQNTGNCPSGARPAYHKDKSSTSILNVFQISFNTTLQKRSRIKVAHCLDISFTFLGGQEIFM